MPPLKFDCGVTDMVEEKLKEQNVMMQNRERITISGVSDVDSFDEHAVVLYTSLGILSVKGTGLHINKLNVETGDLCIEGEIDALAYSQQQSAKNGGWLAKLLK